jgi:histone H3/H4
MEFRKAQIYRLAYREGAKLASDSYQLIDDALASFFSLLIRQAKEYTEHRKAKLVTGNDIKLAVKLIFHSKEVRIKCPLCNQMGTGPYIRMIKGQPYLYIAHRIKYGKRSKQTWCYLGRPVMVESEDAKSEMVAA